jgi:hypothetical protein
MSSAAEGGGHVKVWVPARSSILGQMRTASWTGARLIGRRSAISRPISTETPRRPTSRAHIAESATKVEHKQNRSDHCPVPDRIGQAGQALPACHQPGGLRHRHKRDGDSTLVTVSQKMGPPVPDFHDARVGQRPMMTKGLVPPG